ncbi:unnamed protein product, partial [marine sediment metagenome]
MPVGEVYQLAVDQELNGVLLTNVFYFAQLISGSGDDENDLIDAFEEDVVPTWLLCCSDDWQITCYRARRVSGVGTFAEALQVASGDVGDVVAEPLPANAVAV